MGASLFVLLFLIFPGWLLKQDGIKFFAILLCLVIVIGILEACRELGMSMSTAFTIFAKKMGREKRIPFEVSVDPFYSDSNLSYLKKVIADIDSGRAVLAEHDLIEE